MAARVRGSSRTTRLVAAGAVAIFALMLAQPASAATITVNTTADDGGPGDCELREAIQAANGDGVVSGCPAGSGEDTIVVPAGNYVLAEANGMLVIASQLTVDGSGLAATTIRPEVAGRVIDVTSAGDAELLDLTVTGGVGALDGAGILNGGALTIRNAAVTGNQAFGSLGAGIRNDDELTLINTTVADNQALFAGAGGGGIYSSGTANSTTVLSSVIGSPDSGTTPGNVGDEDGGGILLHNGSLTIRDSLIAHNAANNFSVTGNGGGGGGIEVSTGFPINIIIENSSFIGNDGERGAALRAGGGAASLSITGSTFEGNEAGVVGGAASLHTDGTIVNSTFSGNFAPSGGGGLYTNSGTIGITHTTFTENVTTLRQDAGTINLRGSLIGNSCDLLGGTLNSGGYNVVVDLTCSLGGVADLEGSPIGVAPLADNGGPTRTHALQAGASGLDRAPCAGLAEDQRGVPRPFGAQCDSGAYERMTTCVGLVSKDLIRGTNAGQTLNGSADSEVILGLGGNDTINGGGGNDDVCAGAGNDTVNGGPGNDRLHGEQGTDTVSFAGGAKVNADLASGKATGQGSDTLTSFENLTGTAFADALLGSRFANVILALGGADRIVARGGNDLVKAGGGRDRALGGGGRDRLFGAGGPDRLFGGAGPDRLFGGGGPDRLFGGGGRDLLNGGGRRDLCNGGGGRDRRRARGCERRRSIP